MFIALAIATALLAVICLNSAVMKLRENEQVVTIFGGTVGVPARYFPVLAAFRRGRSGMYLQVAEQVTERGTCDLGGEP